jgi:hypothetical protein
MPAWYPAFETRFKKEFGDLLPLPTEKALNTFTLSLSGNFDYYWSNRDVEIASPGVSSRPQVQAKPLPKLTDEKKSYTLCYVNYSSKDSAAIKEPSTPDEIRFHKELDDLGSYVEMYVRRLLRGIDLSKVPFTYPNFLKHTGLRKWDLQIFMSRKDKPANSRLANDLATKYSGWIKSLPTSGIVFLREMAYALRDDAYIEFRKLPPDPLVQHDGGMSIRFLKMLARI